MVLFICLECHYGHSVLDVEQFYNSKTARQCYLCFKHLDRRTPNLVHMPWDTDFKECSICSSSDHRCMGDHPNVDAMLRLQRAVCAPEAFEG